MSCKCTKDKALLSILLRIDHRQALKHDGKDDPSNMQWQTNAGAKAKDNWD